MLFYATPILYPAEIFPSAIRWVLNLNPFTQIVNAYRDLFMYHTLPSLTSIYLCISYCWDMFLYWFKNI